MGRVRAGPDCAPDMTKEVKALNCSHEGIFNIKEINEQLTE
jgi:hypothetical protein